MPSALSHGDTYNDLGPVRERAVDYARLGRRVLSRQARNAVSVLPDPVRRAEIQPCFVRAENVCGQPASLRSVADPKRLRNHTPQNDSVSAPGKVRRASCHHTELETASASRAHARRVMMCGMAEREILEVDVADRRRAVARGACRGAATSPPQVQKAQGGDPLPIPHW
jgi:hypothetical protein